MKNDDKFFLIFLDQPRYGYSNQVDRISVVGGSATAITVANLQARLATNALLAVRLRQIFPIAAAGAGADDVN